MLLVTLLLYIGLTVVQVLMKDMFVCMGNASTTDTEAWVAQAKFTLDTTTTSSAQTPRASIITEGDLANEKQSTSEVDVSFADSRQDDSGFWSRAKDSTFDSSIADGNTTMFDTTFNSSIASIDAHYETKDQEDKKPGDYNSGTKSVKSRAASENVCVLADGADKTWTTAVAYLTPEQNEAEEEEVVTEYSLTSSVVFTADAETDSNIVFENIDEAGAVIVGTVLKHALSKVTGQDITKSAHNLTVENLLSESSHEFTLDDLDGMEFSLGTGRPKDKPPKTEVATVDETPRSEQDSIPEITLGARSEESDEDSLLNSDNDYDERDDFFRKKKVKKYSLKNKKGVDSFKTFLEETTGKKNWHFWMDIDRAKLIENPHELKK